MQFSFAVLITFIASSMHDHESKEGRGKMLSRQRGTVNHQPSVSLLSLFSSSAAAAAEATSAVAEEVLAAVHGCKEGLYRRSTSTHLCSSF